MTTESQKIRQFILSFKIQIASILFKKKTLFSWEASAFRAVLLFAVRVIMTSLCISSIYAIEIADNFTYDGMTGWEASRALATDYEKYSPFEAVGYLNIYFGEEEYTGSATLLNSEWVLTAAHNWNVSRLTSLEFVFKGITYNADMTSLTQHPLWTSAPFPLANEQVGASQGWDIALFRLSAPIAESIVFPELYTGSDELGKAGIVLGAGRIGTGTVPWEAQPTSDLLIYAAGSIVDRTTHQVYSDYSGGLLAMDFDGENISKQNTLGEDYVEEDLPWIWESSDKMISSLDPEGTILGADSSADQYTDKFGNVLEGGPAPGDSGGPLFIFDGDTWKIAGITSWGTNPWDAAESGEDFRGLYGDVNYFTRISEHVDWIYGVIPEPSSLILLLIGMVGIGIFKQRRKSSDKMSL